ncbi:hypothetical protein KKG41_05750, partial [Patescibacteria group bacterium]|nr:hypothetical protein [Patescibacteria group bacterium]MBU1890691.1 hypothetical protein [Patescibacteria group bacterium]
MKAQFSALVILVVSGSLVISTANAGDVTNTKLLLHATQSVTDSSNWQTASWVVVPNYTNPSKALVLAGL